jgi:hypothetical protein
MQNFWFRTVSRPALEYEIAEKYAVIVIENLKICRYCLTTFEAALNYIDSQDKRDTDTRHSIVSPDIRDAQTTNALPVESQEEEGDFLDDLRSMDMVVCSKQLMNPGIRWNLESGDDHGFASDNGRTGE